VYKQDGSCIVEETQVWKQDGRSIVEEIELYKPDGRCIVEEIFFTRFNYVGFESFRVYEVNFTMNRTHVTSTSV
jgi:hypothetical protein